MAVDTKPGTATNSIPGRTARESWVTPVTSIAARSSVGTGRPPARVPRNRPSVDRRSRSAPRGRRAGDEEGASDALTSSPRHDPIDPRRHPAYRIARGSHHPLMRTCHGHPVRPERALVLVQTRHRVTLPGLRMIGRGVHPTEVHLVAPLADRELDRPPAQQMHHAGMGLADAWGIR